MNQSITEKEYTINGKSCYQTFMSPWQTMRFSALIEEFENFIKEKTLNAIDVKYNADGVIVNPTPFILALEQDRPDLLVSAMNLILKDPKTRKPGYLSNYFNVEDIDGFDPSTMCEVIADFFTLNNVPKILEAASQIKKAMKST